MEHSLDAALSDARLRALLDTPHLYLGILALDGTVLHVNATALNVINATLANVVGRPLWETPWFVETPGLPEAVRHAVTTAAAGAVVQTSIVLNLAAGRRECDFMIRPIRDEDGAVTWLVAEAAEIGNRRQADKVLQKARKREPAGQFIGGQTHDFNNLLTGIIGSLELLQRQLRRSWPPETERHVELAQKTAERASSLSHRLLALARERGSALTAVDVNQVVVGLAETTRQIMGPDTMVEITTDSGLWFAAVDPMLLENALLKLCTRMCNTMPAGGRLVIGTGNVSFDEHSAQEHDLLPGEYVYLRISSNSAGMTHELIAHEFEALIMPPVGESTGLDPSMVERPPEHLSAQVRIDEQSDHGWTAILYMPRHHGREPIASGQP